MRLKFEANGTPVEFCRRWFTGGASLNTPGGTIRLQHAANPFTHFSLKLTRCWVANIAGAEVHIVKTRPLFLAGFRPQRYDVLVNGNVVASQAGY